MSGGTTCVLLTLVFVVVSGVGSYVAAVDKWYHGTLRRAEEPCAAYVQYYANRPAPGEPGCVARRATQDSTTLPESGPESCVRATIAAPNMLPSGRDPEWEADLFTPLKFALPPAAVQNVLGGGAALPS